MKEKTRKRTVVVNVCQPMLLVADMSSHISEAHSSLAILQAGVMSKQLSQLQSSWSMLQASCLWGHPDLLLILPA